MKSLALITALTCLAALLVTPADALEYNVAAPTDYLFGEATSDTTIYEWENPNVDRSKNVALIAPGFGTPTSYQPYSGEPLTPSATVGSSGAPSSAVRESVAGRLPTPRWTPAALRPSSPRPSPR